MDLGLFGSAAGSSHIRNKHRVLFPVQFTESQRGNALVMLHGHKFKRTSQYGRKTWWHCVKRYTKGCPAQIIFGRSRRGNPVIIMGGYRYTKAGERGSMRRWVCDKKQLLRCPAIITTIRDSLLKTSSSHNH
ncbi:unnamed protein product, partial [Iphiclides podalirius]